MPDHLWSGRLESKPTHILNLDVALTKKSDDSSMQSMRTGLDPALLDPHTLQDEVILEIAIGNIEDHLSDPVVNKDHLIDELLSRDSLFEFVFSRLSSNGANVLKRRLLETFPTAAAQFQKSMASKVLARLSLYFWALSYPADHLKECHRAVDLAAPVLNAISMLSFITPSPISPIEDEIPEELEGLIVRRKKQGTRKNARRAPRSPVVDSRPFHNIDVEVPQSDAEARELAVHLLEDQMHILQSYFDVLRNPELSETFKATYIPQISPSDSTTTAVDSDSESASGSTAHEDEAIPSAFPMVQPMKAALYFDSADGFGDWRILISTRADRNLREAKRRDQNLFRIIIKKIKELSNGHFSDDNQKRLSGSDNDIPIYEAKMTRDTRLVYHIDCIKEFENDVEWQVIRIFGIYTHSQLDKRFWEAVGIQLAGKGKEYRKRCVFRNTPHHPGDKVFSPASFPAQENTPLPPASLDIPDLRNEDREELHALLVLEKFVTFSQALLNSILADQDVAHAFQMTPQEQEIVKHSGSCYVLGRSGTGKTTTMLFKMLGIERTYDSMRETMLESFPKPRQIFVTQSRVLAEKVEEYFTKLSESHAAAQRTAEQSVKMAQAKLTAQDQGLVDRDEEQYHRGDLPKSYGELRDEHFPLFLTFDHLSRLLEAEFTFGKYGTAQKFIVNTHSENPLDTLSNDYMQQQRTSFVSYGTFLQAYWPHFPQNLTKNMDPALVFAEFMGVIKGSEETLQTLERFLDRDTYVKLSHRTQGTFATQRDSVYAIFQAYLRLKKNRGDYDAADRTHGILRALRENGVPGNKIDFIYIDEAQDNLLIDALIPRTICRNPEGMFWAGDTAQTISAGSSFRFNDLKAFLYRVEEMNNVSGLQEPPKSFQLTVNYRSHGGIVSCAQSVVELITKFWPHAIDILADERGVIDGIKPLYLTGWDQHSMRYEQFLFGATGDHMEFGAQQCILVRDDVAREKLRQQVGDIGLIMTLYESKGLEFNDVLLYNFFEDSTVDLAQWRVILNTLPNLKNIKCPRFDENRHSGICRDLKFLYVAITRARKNLWIADCSEKSEPMREVWLAKGQIQLCGPGDHIPQLAVTSTPEEWAVTARALFDKRQYMQAIKCYERAGLDRERKVAEAYYHREQARAKTIDDTTRISSFRTVADQFDRCAMGSDKRAEKSAYYRIAAECYAAAMDVRRAAQAYLYAEEYTLAAQYFRKANVFDKAVEVVQTYSARVDPKVADTIISVAKLFYCRENRLEKATKLFPTVEDALEYMEDYGFDFARADLLEKAGKLVDAAELHLAEGRTIKAINLLLKDDKDERALPRAASYVLEGLWKCLSFGIKPNVSRDMPDSTLDPLLSLAEEVMQSASLPDHERTQLMMFQAIASSNFGSLLQLGKKLHTDFLDIPASLLCFDHVFGRPFRFQSLPCPEISAILEGFLLYAEELRKISFEYEPYKDAAVQRLFGFRMSEDQIITVPNPSYMYASVANSRACRSQEDGHVTITSHDFILNFSQVLRNRLQLRVQTADTELSLSPILRPCVVFAVYGECNTNDCHIRNAHVNKDSMNADWYNTRIRVVLQQVQLCQTLRAIQRRWNQDQQRHHWLNVLFWMLYPLHQVFGSIANLDKARIPEYNKGIQVINNWIEEFFFDLNARPSPTELLTVTIQRACLALEFQPSVAHDIFKRSPWLTNLPPTAPKRNGDAFILHDFLEVLSGIQPTSIISGMLGIRHICNSADSLDINLLCHLVDRICGSCIVAARSYGLHDTMFPRSWLSWLPTTERAAQLEVRGSIRTTFIGALSDLLETLFLGHNADHLLRVDEGQFYKRTRARNIMIYRVCRSLALLGYNCRNDKLRWDIIRSISSLRKGTREFSSLFVRYVRADGWSDVVKALRRVDIRSDLDHTLDEFINFKDESRITGAGRTFRGTRTIVFRTPPGALATFRSGVHSNLRAGATPFVPRNLMDHEEEDGEEDDEPAVDEQIDLPEPEGGDEVLTVENSFQPLAPPTEDEIRAVIQIQREYRRRLSRRNKVYMPTESVRLFWYKQCLDTSESVMLRRTYKLMFLGSLPHALVSLQKMNDHAHADKKAARKKMLKADAGELEEVDKHFNETRKLLKDVLHLQKQLTPTSAMHQGQDTVKLRKVVMEVQDLSNRFLAAAKGWEWDLRIAVKGIVQERKQRSKLPKPDLVVEDDICY